MATLKFTVSESRSYLVYLRKTDAGCAFNNLTLMVGSSSYNVRGFVGVRSAIDDEITGGFCWGDGQSLHSLVFKIKPLVGKTSFSFLDIPPGWTVAKGQRYIKAFMRQIGDKLHDRMVKRDLGIKSSGGSYNGLRLEAHSRQKTLPADRFSSALNKFTPVFATTAKAMHITYK